MKIKKRIAIAVLACILGIAGIAGVLPGAGGAQEVGAFTGTSETRAIWLSYIDFGELGLKTNSEETFRANASKFLSKAKSNYINAVCFQVRAFDDAAWKSKTFSAMSYLTSKASSSKKAASTYSFDPLAIMIELAHKNGMELHAWMNPYRLTWDYYLDPAYESSMDRVVTAVKEVMAYDVDGVLFDDYFYHAQKGYKNRDNDKILKPSQLPSDSKKKTYVNKMVKRVYAKVKELSKDAVFGISPQGNIENCRGAGADVDKWMSTEGVYIDYIAPQIYWTDQWGSSGTTKMYTNRIKAWKELKKSDINLYVAMASYLTGEGYKGDPGWGKTSTNLASQLNILRTYGYKGYALFSAKDLYRSGASAELSNLRKMVKHIPRLSVTRNNYKSLNVKWNKIHGMTGYEIYRADSKGGTYKKIKTADAAASSYEDTGLTVNKTYYYKVRAYKGSKKYSFSAVKSQTVKPKTPSVSTKAGKGQITVTWNSVSGVTGYYVYRSQTKSGTYKSLKRVNSKTTQYTNTKLKKGAKYYYKVRSYKTIDGTKIYSDYSECSGKTVK